MNCKICSSVSFHIEKGSKIPYCSKSCQIIGNNIMNLPSEIIEKIIYKLDTNDINRLLSSSVEFRRWFYSNPRYFQYFYIDKVIEYLRGGFEVIFTAEKCALRYSKRESGWIFTYSDEKTVQILKESGFIGQKQYISNTKITYVWFDPSDFDLEKFLQTLWNKFNYKYFSRRI
jgi:hypothetical protein